MLNRAGTFIFLRGDLVTLDALIIFTSSAHLNSHKKLIGLLIINNFYNDLMTFFNHAIKYHFISFSAKKTLYLCLTIKKLFKLELDRKTLVLNWLTNDSSSSLVRSANKFNSLCKFFFYSVQATSSKCYFFPLRH